LPLEPAAHQDAQWSIGTRSSRNRISLENMRGYARRGFKILVRSTDRRVGKKRVGGKQKGVGGKKKRARNLAAAVDANVPTSKKH
jgi:hypothetical protein